MALFTQEQANACTIVRLEKHMKDGVYTSMIIGVTDADGNYYDWSDDSISEDVTKDIIKTDISAYLQANVNKREKPIVDTYESMEDKGLGETVG
jgi:hypothetical protein